MIAARIFKAMAAFCVTASVWGCESRPAVVRLGGRGGTAVKAIGSTAGESKAVLKIDTGALRNAEFHRDGLYSTANGKPPMFRSMNKARVYKKKPSLNVNRAVKKMGVDMKAKAGAKANMRRHHNLTPIWLKTQNNAKIRSRNGGFRSIRPMYMDPF